MDESEPVAVSNDSSEILEVIGKQHPNLLTHLETTVAAKPEHKYHSRKKKNSK